jgi:hypothetical protein
VTSFLIWIEIIMSVLQPLQVPAMGLLAQRRARNSCNEDDLVMQDPRLLPGSATSGTGSLLFHRAWNLEFVWKKFRKIWTGLIESGLAAI